VKGLQLAGALVAAGTVLAAWAPRDPAPSPPPPAASPVAEAAPPLAVPPAPAQKPRAKAKARAVTQEWLERVLARKMPETEPSERLRLARTIMEEARFAAIDPLFVVALIAVESGFDHGAESVRGARGLMQLRDDTLAAEAERSDLDGDLDDPETNVRAGVRYYRRLLRSFGSHELALMAYNAGPNRILRYLRDEGEVPERFQSYPRRVHAELSKLQRAGPGPRPSPRREPAIAAAPEHDAAPVPPPEAAQSAGPGEAPLAKSAPER
jgi:soluble lytic murein transglycosylase-like protein